MLRCLFLRSLIMSLSVIMLVSCGDDDGGGGNNAPDLRDPQEVWTEDSLEIKNFLENYSFSLQQNPINPNLQTIVYDTIAGENSGATPIIESPLLESINIEQDGVDYEIFLLKVKEGAASQRRPKETDSTLVSFRAKTIDNEVFNSSPNPAWFDLANEIRGYRLGLSKLRGSSGFTENQDGTVSFNQDFGFAAIFVPSGLGFFATPPLGTPLGAYEPLIVDFQLYKSVESDHDQDGIPSHLEDIDGDGLIRDDDTDSNGTPNYLDVDDDGDETLTSEEIFTDDNGELQMPDTNGNGTPDYLDPTFPVSE